MNSICLLFLGIGIFGKPASIQIKPMPMPEEIVPVIVEPMAPPPTTIQELKPEEESEQEKQDMQPVVVVAPNAPDITFAVPTIGNLLVPSALAVAPPLRPMIAPVAKPVAPLQEGPSTLNNTGVGGERPQPPYPPAALEHRQQGTVVLTLTVDETGNVATIDVKTSSGYPVLDRSTLDYVKRYWRVPPGAGTR